MSQCLTCAEEAREGSMFCAECRPPSDAISSAPPHGERCAGCVRENDRHASECYYCETDGDEVGNPTNYEAAPKPKAVQTDLEGNVVTVPVTGCIKIPPERYIIKTPKFVLRGKKDEMLEVAEGGRNGVRLLVQQSMRVRKNALISPGDFDRMVDWFTDAIMGGIIDRLPEDD